MDEPKYNITEYQLIMLVYWAIEVGHAQTVSRAAAPIEETPQRNLDIYLSTIREQKL